MTQQTDLKLILKEQVPLTFVASDPLGIEPVIPPNPQAKAQIRQAILRWFAIQIAVQLIEQSQNQEV